MPVLTSGGWVSVGFRVQQRGRYNKWENRGLYGDREGAEFAIARMYGTNPYTGNPVQCRIVEEAV